MEEKIVLFAFSRWALLKKNWKHWLNDFPDWFLTCHRTFTDGLARIIKCKKKAMSTTKCETILQTLQCNLFDVDWRDRYSSTLMCNVVFNSDVYKGRKKNKSRVWWTTCENKKNTPSPKKTFDVCMTPCTQNAKLFISRGDLIDQLAWFPILGRVQRVVYDDDNDGGKIIAHAKLNEVTYASSGAPGIASVVLSGSDDAK